MKKSSLLPDIPSPSQSRLPTDFEANFNKFAAAEGKEEFMKEQYECAAKELLAGRTVTKDDFGTPKQCAGLFWGAAVICFISLVWMGEWYGSAVDYGR